MPEEVPREVRMAGIRERAARAGRSGVLAHSDRRFLLAEVDRLALALAEVEHEANKQIRLMFEREKTKRDALTERAQAAEREEARLKRDNEEMTRTRSEWHIKYLMLSQSVAHLVNRNLRNFPSDAEVLMGAMTVRTLEVEQECTAKLQESTQRLNEAEHQCALAAERLDKEAAIRRRVHERFKRVRREVILASETIKKQRLDLKRARQDLEREAEFGLSARRFAALAYRALESEDLEDRGQEPMWP